MILVTGASGLLGANFLHAAIGQGHRVTGVYHDHPVRFPGADTVATNLTVAGAAAGLIRDRKPEWVVHCAAATDVDWCQAHPAEARRLNVDATSELAAACRETGARLLYVSTDAVFDGKSGAYVERDIPAPVNVYGETKLEGERAATQVLPACLIVRTCIYGWNLQPKPSLAEWILAELEAEREVPGFTDVVFTPLLVNDLSAVLLNMVRSGLEGTYHVAGSEGLSKYEFARRLAVLFGHPAESVVPSTLHESSLRAPRPRNTSLRIDRIRTALGTELPNVEEGLRRFKKLREDGFLQRLRACRAG